MSELKNRRSQTKRPVQNEALPSAFKSHIGLVVHTSRISWRAYTPDERLSIEICCLRAKLTDLAERYFLDYHKLLLTSCCCGLRHRRFYYLVLSGFRRKMTIHQRISPSSYASLVSARLLRSMSLNVAVGCIWWATLTSGCLLLRERLYRTAVYRKPTACITIA